MSISLLDHLWNLHQDPMYSDKGALMEDSLSHEEGQRIQVNLLQRWLDQGEEIGGWKIGMTSGASRNAMGEGVRPFGFILKSRVKLSGTKLPLGSLHSGGVENEVCFGFKNRLLKGTTQEEAKNAVEAIYPAFEINQKRLPADASSGLRIADNLSNWGIVHGAKAETSNGINSIEVSLSHDDKPISHVSSEGHIDDHYKSIATLVNILGDFGQAIEPGQKIITGAFGKTAFSPGIFRGEFSDGVGHVELELTS